MRTKGKLSDEMDRAFRYSYRLDEFVGQWTHRYIVEGSVGAIEFHVTDCLYEGRHSCGLEIHSTITTNGRRPDHGQCAAVSMRPCWHDGTTLYAVEKFLPMWLEMRNSPDAFLSLLANEYSYRFGWPDITGKDKQCGS